VGQDNEDVGRRALGVLLAALLAFACVVMSAAMTDIGGTPTCHDISVGNAAIPSDGECFRGSSLQKTVTLGLGWPSGMIAGVAGLIALAFAITGRRPRLALMLTALAIALGGLSILIGSV
jgi:membrane-associated PAP2 superfamily phosphatase